eukprot:1635414-Karenia_brevis.AAC.1
MGPWGRARAHQDFPHGRAATTSADTRTFLYMCTICVNLLAFSEVYHVCMSITQRSRVILRSDLRKSHVNEKPRKQPSKNAQSKTKIKAILTALGRADLVPTVLEKLGAGPKPSEKANDQAKGIARGDLDDEAWRHLLDFPGLDELK